MAFFNVVRRKAAHYKIETQLVISLPSSELNLPLCNFKFIINLSGIFSQTKQKQDEKSTHTHFSSISR